MKVTELLATIGFTISVCQHNACFKEDRSFIDLEQCKASLATRYVVNGQAASAACLPFDAARVTMESSGKFGGLEGLRK